jgi:hypothetical protein
MKATKGTILAAVFLGLSCLTSTSLAGPSDTSCSINIPAGTIIRVYPDEQLVAGTTSGPLLFTIAADVRFFLNRPPLLPRGSKILGRMETSGKAGRLWGRAKAQVVFTSILTPDYCEYPIDATLIGTKKYQVHEGVIVGRGHPRRDALALIFPPTTLYQLIRLPARGPKLTIREEDQLVVKLTQSVYLARSQPDQPGAPEQARQLTPVVVAPKPATPECSKLTSSRLAFPTRLGSLRSFQNPTVYDVVVYSNGIPVGAIAPCSESVLSLPRGDVKLKAIATVPEETGQREVEAALGLNDKLTGWQVLSVPAKVSAKR